MVELYLHSPVHIHGLLHNELRPRDTFAFPLPIINVASLSVLGDGH
jgi:hypothetical protein